MSIYFAPSDINRNLLALKCHKVSLIEVLNYLELLKDKYIDLIVELNISYCAMYNVNWTNLCEKILQKCPNVITFYYCATFGDLYHFFRMENVWVCICDMLKNMKKLEILKLVQMNITPSYLKILLDKIDNKYIKELCLPENPHTDESVDIISDYIKNKNPMLKYLNIAYEYAYNDLPTYSSLHRLIKSSRFHMRLEKIVHNIPTTSELCINNKKNWDVLITHNGIIFQKIIDLVSNIKVNGKLLSNCIIFHIIKYI